MNLYLFIYLVLLVITLSILYRKQKATPYLKVGWFFNLLTFAYYGFPIIYIIYWPQFSYSLSNRNFSDSFVISISSILLVCQLGFLLAELFVKNGTTNIFFSKKLYPIKSSYIFVLLLLTYIMFFYRWSSVGGFLTVISQSRVEYMNDASEASGIFSRYDILFYVVTAFIVNNISTSSGYIKKNKLIMSFYALFVILSILMGTRLLLLTTVLGFFAGFFFSHKEYLKKHRKKIILGSLLLMFGFSAFTTVRTYLTEYFSSGNFTMNNEDISLVPAELFTGVLSHHSIENGVKVEGFTFLQRLIPDQINSSLGLESITPYTQQIAMQSMYSSGRAVFTVPYLTDLYFSVNQNLMYFLLLNIFIYLTFNFIQVKLVNKNIIYLFLFYILMYYVLRVESPVWFGRFYLSFILLFIVLLLGGRNIYLKVKEHNNGVRIKNFN